MRRQAAELSKIVEKFEQEIAKIQNRVLQLRISVREAHDEP